MKQSEKEKYIDFGKKWNEGHNNPSPETVKMVGELDKKLAVYCEKMEEISKKVDEGFKLNTEQHKEMMEEFKIELDKKAGKWVEKVIWAVIGSIFTGLLGVIGTLVFQGIVHFN